MKLGPYLTLLREITSKYIKHLNVRSETIILLEENVGKKQLDFSLVDDLLDMIPRAKALKAKTSEWDYIKERRLCKETKYQ